MNLIQYKFIAILLKGLTKITYFIVNFSDILTAGTRTKAEPLLQLRANSGSAFIVLTGKEEESKGKDCWFNITYRYFIIKITITGLLSM